MTNLGFANGGRISVSNGVIGFISTSAGSTTVRVDHNYFDQLGGTGSVSVLFNNAVGVMDHNAVITTGGSTAIDVFNGSWEGNDETSTCAGGCGDHSWNESLTWGGADFFFIESNRIENLTRVFDCLDGFRGMRVVVRFNELNNCNIETHGTESSGRMRGSLAVEVYFNDFTYTFTQYNFMADLRSGSALVHNNTGVGIPATARSITLRNHRSLASFSPFGQADGDNAWDTNSGSNPFVTGTASSAGALTVTDSSKSWTVNEWRGYMVKQTSGSCTNPCAAVILSNTATQLTFDSSGGYGSGNLSFSAGNGYEINAVTQSLDGIGRVGGSLVSGVTPTQPAGWNDQTANPVYEWLNTNDGSIINASRNNSCLPACVENTHFYNYTASFNGTVGTGSGVRAARPVTCTTGVVYWSTDQGGNWNMASAGANDGTLDKCTATDTWTNAWYTPYDYPHSLAATSALSFTAQPASLHSGNTFTSFTVAAQIDGVTNVSFTDNISLAISGCSAALGGTTTAAAVAGVATFGSVTSSSYGSNCRIVASATDYTSATSDPFNVTPTQLGFTVQPSGTQTSGSSITFTVAGQDPSAVTDTSATNSVTISATATSGSCAVSGSTTQSLSSGVRAFSLTISGAGTCYLTAAATGLTSGTSSSFTVSGDSLAFTTQPPSSIGAGVPFTVAVTVRYPNGSTDSSVTNAVTLTGSGCIVSAPLGTPSSGVATFTASVTAGPSICTIIASASNVTSGSSNTFTVSGGSPAVTTVGRPRIRARIR